MAAGKPVMSLRFRGAVMLIIAVLAAACTQKVAWSQPAGCTAELSSLNVCAPFVVPGSSRSNPSPDCCTALQTVDHDCMCNTLRIASRLPSRCNVAPLNCDANA